VTRTTSYTVLYLLLCVIFKKLQILYSTLRGPLILNVVKMCTADGSQEADMISCVHAGKVCTAFARRGIFLAQFCRVQLNIFFASLEFFTVVWLRSSFFWDMTPRHWLIKVQRTWRWRQSYPSIHWELIT